MPVARVWAKHGLQPHRLDRYMASNDPHFETKAANVIGLYLNPPQRPDVSVHNQLLQATRRVPRLSLHRVGQDSVAGNACTTLECRESIIVQRAVLYGLPPSFGGSLSPVSEN
jgi:hypothetical protein